MNLFDKGEQAYKISRRGVDYVSKNREIEQSQYRGKVQSLINQREQREEGGTQDTRRFSRSASIGMEVSVGDGLNWSMVMRKSPK